MASPFFPRNVAPETILHLEYVVWSQTIQSTANRTRQIVANSALQLQKKKKKRKHVIQTGLKTGSDRPDFAMRHTRDRKSRDHRATDTGKTPEALGSTWGGGEAPHEVAPTGRLRIDNCAQNQRSITKTRRLQCLGKIAMARECPEPTEKALSRAIRRNASGRDVKPPPGGGRAEQYAREHT